MNGAWGGPVAARDGSPPLSGVVLVLALAGVGLVMGVLVTKLSLLVLAAAALGGGALVLVLVRWPEVGPSLFWLAYSLQGTVFAGFSITGMYYPLYALMAVNAVLALLLKRMVIGWRLLPYALFLFVILLSLLPVSDVFDFATKQRLFIYFIGFLVFFQFPTRRVAHLLIWVQVVSTLAIGIWVVTASVASGFAYRAGVDVNQNSVSFVLAFGILAMLGQVMGRKLNVWAAVALWAAAGVGFYGMLLLSSRGMSIGLALAAIVMYGRIVFKARRRSLLILIAALAAGAVLMSLPGSNELFVRFNSADVASANQRLPLWKASINEIESSNLYQLLLGRGFASSMTLIRRVSVTLTSTHNAYIQMLYDFGFVGLFVFLWMHAALLARFWRSTSATALYASGVVVFILMADATMTAPDQFLYWIAIGHLLALCFVFDREDAERAEARPVLAIERS